MHQMVNIVLIYIWFSLKEEKILSHLLFVLVSVQFVLKSCCDRSPLLVEMITNKPKKILVAALLIFDIKPSILVIFGDRKMLFDIFECIQS